MKKFIAVVLALVLCMSLCAFASAATTEARSGNIYVTVKQFEIEKAGTETSSISKAATATSAVVANVELKDTNRAVEYTLTSTAGLSTTKNVAAGSKLDITAGDVMTGVTTSQKVTVTVTAKVTSGNGSAYDAKESVAITFTVVVAGKNIPEDDEKDPDGEKTTGDFQCTISGPTEVYEGDAIALIADSTLTGDTLAVLGANWKSGVTYKIYVMKGEEEVGAIYANSASTSYEWAVLDLSEYTFWAVATLNF